MTRKAHAADGTSRLFSQIIEDSALNNTKKSLVFTCFCFKTALRPTVGAFHGLFNINAVVGVRTFIECHDNIRTQFFLDLYRAFRCKAFHRPIDVRFEGHTVLIHLAHVCQGKDLEAARIGQHWFVPLHELVQSAHFGYPFVAGAQKEVVGVG